MVSIWAIISAKKSNMRVDEYNIKNIRLKYRPLLDLENGWQSDPVECLITFNIVAFHNEAHITKIDVLTKDFACCQSKRFPINMAADDVVLLSFVCFHQEDFKAAQLSVDVYYEDVAGTKYKTHIEGTQSGLTTNPAILL